MALLEIIPDSDPIMRKSSRRVRHVDDELREFVADMYDSMVVNLGIGLAAIQVGVPKRLFIYEIPVRPEVSEDEGEEEAGSDEIEEEIDVENEESDEECITEELMINPGYTGEYTVCINPKITEREGSYIDEEGCLSRVGWVAKVDRSYKITLEAYDLDMNKFTKTITGLEARCVQHEFDHLDGILFTDRMIEGSLREITDDEEEEETESGSNVEEPEVVEVTSEVPPDNE